MRDLIWNGLGRALAPPSGKEAKQPLRKGEAMRVATGGMLPPGADAVVMIEYAEEVGDGTAFVPLRPACRFLPASPVAAHKSRSGVVS